jgi:recombination protein RecT
MAENEMKLSFSNMINDKLVAVQDALPKEFNKQRFVQNSLALINENPELKNYEQKEVLAGLVRGAYLGLDFIAKECYLIPYKNKVQFQLSYKGTVKFVKKYSIRPIKDIYAMSVRQGDTFKASVKDGKPSLDFEPIPFNGDEIVGVFALVLYQDGGMEYETMTKDEVNATRNNYSKAANSDAWKKSWEEMARKTVLRRLCKHIETDFESIEARSAWEEGGDFEVKKPVPSEIVADPFTQEDVIDVEATEVEEEINEDLPDFLQD